MKCKICQTNSKYLFKTKVLNKYEVNYYQCPNCEFIQTDTPFWLDEAYSHAITELDVGLVYRNLQSSESVEKLIVNNFNQHKTFLDYAGGYGLFVRIMRDKGFDFYRQDKYCENIFAKLHDIVDLKSINKFEVLTAFEFFEHLEDPLSEIKTMLSLSDNIIFSTELIPENKISNQSDWWYFVPETGQHIAFYSTKTLDFIAHKLHLHFYSQNNLHLYTKIKLENNPFLFPKVSKKLELQSLIMPDYKKAKSSPVTNNFQPSPKQNEKIIPLLAKVIKLKKRINFLKLRNSNYRQQLSQQNAELVTIKTDRDTILSNLNAIYSSSAWKLIKRYYNVRDILIPKFSLRKKILKKLLNLLKSLNRHPSVTTKRNINLHSRKIVYIGHSYHTKTKSTGFLLDFLKQNFEVTEISEDSWAGKPYPDLSFIDDSYLGVIFFQDLPPNDKYNQIHNENLIFFPMYDSLGGYDYSYWKNYKNLKIINFSLSLHDKLLKWGFESIYIKYFPKPLELTTNKENEIFFWQRTDKININLIEKLLGDTRAKIHIHKATDPGFTFTQPTKKQEKKYSISYSDWFPSKTDLYQTLQPCNIYIAPREYEGIGLSYLEAMAMGKVVVAVNNPTMNEYIVNNQTGYLYDINNVKPIDFSHITLVQKQAYESIQRGYLRWLQKRNDIIAFINKR